MISVNLNKLKCDVYILKINKLKKIKFDICILDWVIFDVFFFGYYLENIFLVSYCVLN